MFKPLLSAKIDRVESIRFPVLVSPKFDGVRSIMRDAVVFSRNIKTIPNKHIQWVLGKHRLDGLDGELIVGKPTAPDVFNATSSAVMSVEGEPKFTFFVFDYVLTPDQTFKDRLKYAENLVLRSGIEQVRVVPHVQVNSVEQLLRLELKWLQQGYEGVMIRDPRGRYKYGRSTFNEGILIALKRFKDSEAVVTGWEEMQHNENEQTENALGVLERSSHKAGMVAAGTIGKLKVRDLHSGVDFKVGSGLSQRLRDEMWKKRDTLAGLVIKYKYQPVGVKDKPRLPVFLGVRDAIDL